MATWQRPSALDRYRTSLNRVATLTPAKEKELARQWREGNDDAGRRLIEASLPFVIKIAREYRRWGVPLEDLIQQGNLGLLKAAKKFDTDKDCRLVTYAVYWIRAEIRDYVVRTYRIVRLGTTRTERKAMRSYRRSGVETPEELAESSGMPLARAKKLWPLLAAGDVSLDFRTPDRGPAVERMVADGENPEEAVTRDRVLTGVQKALVDAMTRLSEREQRIVKARLMADEPQTLEMLGNEMGVSKERVRQIEERVRRKLAAELSDYRPAA
ncbi:MAG: sigma-70 family RNA polymerase sigma factor [Myxococcota bacterium]